MAFPNPASSVNTEELILESQLGDLLPALQRLDLLLKRAVESAVAAYGAEAVTDPFRGLHISTHDVERSLNRDPGASILWGTGDEMEICLVQPGEEKSRLAFLQETFALQSFDLNFLLIGLAPEVDLRYERIFAFLQDDVTKKWPSVDFALNLLYPSLSAKLSARQRFSSQAPLLKNCLIHLYEDPSHPNPPLLGKYYRVDERIVSYLFDSEEFDNRLFPSVRLVEPEAELQTLYLPNELKRRLFLQVSTPNNPAANLILYFRGPYGVGRRTAAEAMCKAFNLQLMIVDLPSLLVCERVDFETRVRLVVREASLQNAALYWNGFESLCEENERSRLQFLLMALEENERLAILAGETDWGPADALRDKRFIRFDFPLPDFRDRVRLWQRFLGVVRIDEIEMVAGKFLFSGGQIRDAAATARNLAWQRDSENLQITSADLHEACRIQSNRKLGELARRITPQYTWDDMVLPAAQLTQLKEICNHVRYRPLVYERWGFDRKFSGGKGLNILFAGPSGTGKTMAAEIIAKELGLDLYKIDLSMVVSKYIGETEKNLARIFREAETSNAILFFDEADALFGKRSEVRDSHDRYANIEISYLLQKMEEYEGLSILATNLRKNMDDAFVRRLAMTVHFPFPEEDDRRRIWEGVWPDGAPRSGDLDLAFAARRFKITGGNIRNIALAAAFLAAANGREVAMEHLVRAIKREYQKMGKVCVEADFGPYYPIVTEV